MDKISIESNNLRYLLWKEEKIDRESWVDQLGRVLNCSQKRAKQLLLNELPTKTEVENVAKAYTRSYDEFLVSLFFDDKVDVLPENLKYLFESIKQKELADKIGVKERTVSRWKNGDHDISDFHLTEIRQYFGLPFEINLRNDPIFLSWLPIDDPRRRQWLQRRIQEIDSDKLRNFFPALEKLLKY